MKQNERKLLDKKSNNECSFSALGKNIMKA